ncbi:MAG: LysM peptidoglycan-binding domain-containing protein, partial [Rhodospirillales bacterium]|nr:LysM peptidoglycan-binding domain-containing protein [Rhodospirillales bacterium]
PKRYESYGTEMRDPATPGKIKVGDGDNLWSLSKRLGVSVDELRAANPDLNKNGDIRAGGYLNLPKPKEEKPQPQEQPQPEAAPQPTEPPQETESENRQTALGADGQAFLERIGQPNQRPVLDIATKDPQHWTKDEVDMVIQHYQRFSRPEPLNEWLRDQASEHFKSRYGDVEMIRDLSGRMVERTPLATTPPFTPGPDPKAMQKALEQIGGKLAPVFDADGLSGATKSMQQGLNLLNRDQMPRLKTDGDWGPITDFSFKKSVASHGAAKMDEGFALGRSQSLCRETAAARRPGQADAEYPRPALRQPGTGRRPCPGLAGGIEQDRTQISGRLAALEIGWRDRPQDGQRLQPTVTHRRPDGAQLSYRQRSGMVGIADKNSRNGRARPQGSRLGRDSLSRPNSLFTAILSLTRHTQADSVAAATTLIAPEKDRRHDAKPQRIHVSADGVGVPAADGDGAFYRICPG